MKEWVKGKVISPVIYATKKQGLTNTDRERMTAEDAKPAVLALR